MENRFDNQEEYILTLINVLTEEVRVVKAKDRLEFSKVMEGLVRSQYSIVDVCVIRNTITGGEFIKELIEESRPDDMEFGVDFEK